MNRRIEKECESGLEYLLPDYMGDVKKLLTSKARIVPTGKFVSDGSVEVSGNVEYDLLYLDSAGKLTAVNSSSDFSESFEIDGESYIDSAEESRVCALKVRVTGPRKISLKADVKTVLTVSEDRILSVDGNAFSEEGRAVEKCITEVSCVSSVFEKSAAVEYAEVLESFDDLSVDGTEIISSNAQSKITDAKVGEGEVTLKGENVVSAILLSPEGTPRLIKKAFPFEEKIAVEGASENMSVIPSSDILSADVSLSADGEYMSAIANLTSQYSVELIENKTAEVITDAYTPSCECMNKYSDTEFSELIGAGRESFLVSVKCDKAEQHLEGLCEIISAGAEVRGLSSEVTADGGRFCGEIVVNGLGYETNVDGSVTYLPFKIQGQFDEKVNFPCQIKDKTMLDALLSVEDVEITNEEENLSARCLISVKYRLLSTKTVRRITLCEALESEQNEGDKSSITVYYPRNGERLFDVAKKYRTTSEKIAKDNELSESALASFDSPDSLFGVKKLIIR